jgi:O6-methylguanine-DNA--protein-cysteine methyltransferase
MAQKAHNFRSFETSGGYCAIAWNEGGIRSNPVPLIIPCHRVLAAGGKLGGFSAPGGADAKLRMLELEGFQRAPAAATQHSMDF